MSLLAVLIFSACNTETNTSAKNTHTIAKKPSLEAPTFKEDSAYAYIKKQVDYGPRVPGLKAHTSCATYLKDFFTNIGMNAYFQEATIKAYNGKNLNIKNICARFKPSQKQRVVLFAHWDSRHIADRDTKNKNQPILGANDGASGVGVIMEIMRAISSAKIKPNIGIDIVLFDAEDYGQPSNVSSNKTDTWALGSQYWSRNISFGKKYNPKYGILLDMVGAKNAVFPKEGHSMRHARNLVENIWNTAAQYGYANHFTNQIEPYGITDDHKYVNEIAHIPTVDIIHYDVSKRDFGHFHHTHKDNMDVIHKSTLKAVGQTLLQVLYKES